MCNAVRTHARKAARAWMFIPSPTRPDQTRPSDRCCMQSVTQRDRHHHHHHDHDHDHRYRHRHRPTANWKCASGCWSLLYHGLSVSVRTVHLSACAWRCASWFWFWFWFCTHIHIFTYSHIHIDTTLVR